MSSESLFSDEAGFITGLIAEFPDLRVKIGAWLAADLCSFAHRDTFRQLTEVTQHMEAWCEICPKTRKVWRKTLRLGVYWKKFKELKLYLPDPNPDPHPIA